jgi:hypothetical protein
LRIALWSAGGVCLILAAVVGLTGGFATSIAGIELSATSPARLFFEASVLLLLGTLVSPKPARHLIAFIALFLIAAAADSEVRRVGDGFEYLGMARNLARLSPPSLSADEASALTREMAALGDTTWDGVVIPTLRGADGRYDFPHFWLYSLAAAPFVALAAAAGVHPSHGFTVMNLVLVLGVCWLLARVGAGLAAVLFAALVLWWIDKAHAEIFFAALTAAALLMRTTAPGASLVMLGAAAAQGPVLAVLLAACVVEALARSPSKRIVIAAVAAFALAALHPLYYLWRLGIPSPLPDTIIAHMPSLRAFVTPLTDLNLGVFWFAPVLAVLTVAGMAAAIRRRQWDGLPVVIGTAALLAAAAMVTNVNHGGTPGMSRYGLWVLSLLIPFAAQVRPTPGWGHLATAGTVFTVIFAAFALHPRVADAGITPTPTPLAAFVWTHVPSLDNPLPEVFVERVVHADGAAPLPVALPGGAKALIACERPGALCYVNGDRIVAAPRQPGFSR